ncbi:glycosyltransferase [Microaceticoccus formicicus]|uniref:glycosyltransferase n=1 Tax=Microaceticoccus formicicus TaxID=3118105 RepID=UPI003CD01DA6|nr:glycosyltransferase [Peptoniphilaceae bacterium AMB_02]
MKICYLADASSVHTHKWCEHFTKIGYSTIVVSLGDGKIPNTKVYSLGIEDLTDRSHINKLLNYITKIGRVKRIIKEENPDIIHAHYATSYGLLASLLNLHPYILSVWGSDVYDFPNSGTLQRKMLEWNLKNADILLSTSDAMREETAKYTDKEIGVTPFGVDTGIYKPLDIDPISDFTIGTIKSFYPKYGIEYLIKGYSDFIKETGAENTKLILGGKGPQEDELRALAIELGIEEKVEFLGFLDRDGVVNSFNKMDIAVFPSTLDSESFGVAAVEAGACGTPTIVSNVGGLPEATKPGYSSITVPKKDSRAITEALKKLYNDRELLNQMKINSRQYVLDTYDINKNFALVDEIYKEIYNSKHNQK